jgi:hypothetical protein
MRGSRPWRIAGSRTPVTTPAGKEQEMEAAKESGKGTAAGLPPGIVIHDGFEPPARTSISAFIWGGKTRPVPALPYGQQAG